jgi:hypothetical protein
VIRRCRTALTRRPRFPLAVRPRRSVPGGPSQAGRAHRTGSTGQGAQSAGSTVSIAGHTYEPLGKGVLLSRFRVPASDALGTEEHPIVLERECLGPRRPPQAWASASSPCAGPCARPLLRLFLRSRLGKTGRRARLRGRPLPLAQRSLSAPSGEGEPQVPDPLPTDLPEVLPGSGQGTPAVAIPFSVFIGQRSLERPTPSNAPRPG